MGKKQKAIIEIQAETIELQAALIETNKINRAQLQEMMSMIKQWGEALRQQGTEGLDKIIWLAGAPRRGEEEAQREEDNITGPSTINEILDTSDASSDRVVLDGDGNYLGWMNSQDDTS